VRIAEPGTKHTASAESSGHWLPDRRICAVCTRRAGRCWAVQNGQFW